MCGLKSVGRITHNIPVLLASRWIFFNNKKRVEVIIVANGGGSSSSDGGINTIVNTLTWVEAGRQKAGCCFGGLFLFFSRPNVCAVAPASASSCLKKLHFGHLVKRIAAMALMGAIEQVPHVRPR